MDKKIVFNGEELVIKRGQHLTGRNVLSKETGINPYSVRRRLILLSKLDFLHIKVNNKFSIITICNYDDYQLPNDVTAQQDAQQLHNNCTTTAQQLHTPNELNKDNKRNKRIYSPNSDEFRLSTILLSCIKNRNPTFKTPDLQSWSKQIDLMIRVDGRLVAEIENVIKLCQQDVFWQNNILSTDKLRKQFDQLKLKLLKQQQTIWPTEVVL